jgi:formate hydrogenlyase subunit 6/NADH:ubiquinone oxidoreductase subunit I
MKRIRSFLSLIGNFFRKPVTVKESFGFLPNTFRNFPRRDDDKCTGCGACYERCSSGATHLTDVDTKRTVCIDSLNCIFCGRCADTCPEVALALSSEPQTEEQKKALENTLSKLDKGGKTCINCISSIDQDSDAGEKYVREVSLAYESGEDKPCQETVLELQRCRVCGEIMPETIKHLKAVRERTLKNLKPETAAIIEEDMKKYLDVCVACRQKYSLIWGTHPRKFV